MSNTDLDRAVRERYEGAFIDASDIMASGDITLTIAGVIAPGAEKDASGKIIDKALVAFEKAKKRLVLNKINEKIIAMMHGNKASEWAGKQIRLTVRYLDKAFGQANVPVVRVVPGDDKPMTFSMRKKYGSATPYKE